MNLQICSNVKSCNKRIAYNYIQFFSRSNDFPNVRNNVVMLHQNVSQCFLIFKTNVMEQKVKE
jgi:hypothetical protein